LAALVQFFTNGALILLTLIRDALSLAHHPLWRPEVARTLGPRIYLVLWAVGTTAFYVLFAPFIAARHVLLILPALMLLLVIRWEGLITLETRVFGLALTVIVSAGLCFSDWRFAEFYKSEVATLAQSLSTAHSVWISGHWGWQWYATQVGFREIDVRSSDLISGDYFVVAEDADPQTLDVPRPLRLVRTDGPDASLLNPFCTGRDARFYTSNYKVAPWSLSRNCLNHHVKVFQVEGHTQPME
jgi:hypothetical protein